MATHRLFILALAALPFMTEGAAAQDTARYRSWDFNNDGVITRAEWRGTLPQFRALDTNGDGVITGSELDDYEVGAGTSDPWDARTFATLDRNNDGRISRGEWRADRATFLRVDRNNDNHVSRGEFLNANVTYDDYDLTDFNALDNDRSGRIERDEWRGTGVAFNRMDVNRDGALTRREFAAVDAVGADADLDDFDVLDYNNNGVISRDEWRDNPGSFNRYDVNRDGVISRREYLPGNVDPIARDTVRVDARQPWTNTGVYVNAGDVVNVSAQGDIQMSQNPDDRANPAGSVTGRNARNSPRPDQRAGGLLVRVGNGPVGFLGASGLFTAERSGELQLGVNDDHFQDNNGEYQVSLSIRRR